MSDLISIERLRVNCIIGCLPEERKTPQDILVSVTLETDVSPAANADDLSLTIDYHALAQSITRFAQSHPFRLIETMAEKIAELCRETSEKYVEPLNPIQFLPWDDSQFIMQSQKDG